MYVSWQSNASPTDWRGEVSVQGRSQSVMVIFWWGHLSAAKVGCLSHAARSHDPHQLVEVGIIWTYCQIQGLCERLQSGS